MAGGQYFRHYHPTDNLRVAAGSQTVGTEWPAANGPTVVVINNTTSSPNNRVNFGALSSDRSTATFTQTAGVLLLGNNSLTATAFSGMGQGISGINASNLSAGTVSSSRLPAATTLSAGVVSTGAQEFVGVKRFAKGFGINADNPANTAWPLYVQSSTGDPSITSYNTSSNGFAIQAAYYDGRSNPIQFTYGTSVNTLVEVARISGTSTTITYGTGSDYRLKENVVPLTDAITKLKLLTPKRFTWIKAPEEGVVEGFIAHELQAVVPQAVDGEKDGFYPDGKIKLQCVDSSMLVPLLTAALQEAVARIEALEAQLGT